MFEAGGGCIPPSPLDPPLSEVTVSIIVNVRLRIKVPSFILSATGANSV